MKNKIINCERIYSFFFNINIVQIIIILWVSFLAYQSFLFAQWKNISLPNEGIVIALTSIGKDIFTASPGNGIYFTTDLGANWKTVNNNLPVDKLHNYGEISDYIDVTFLSAVGENIYAATSFHGLFISTNKGKNWIKIENNLDNVNDVKSIVMIGNNIFIAKQWGICLSTDNGANWEYVNDGLPQTTYDMLKYPHVSSLAVIENNIIAGTEYDGVYLSANSGENWIEVNTGLTDKHINALAVSDSVIFAGTNVGLFISTNKGQEWKLVDYNQIVPTKSESTKEYQETGIFHTVEKGETLIGIALMYDISVQELKILNSLKGNSKIRAGQKLKIKDNSADLESTKCDNKIVVRAITICNSNVFTANNINYGSTEIWYKPIDEVLSEIKNE